MRALRITLMGLVAFLLSVTQGLTQIQFQAKGGGSIGMDFRSGKIDPNQLFDGLAGGKDKDVWIRPESGMQRAMFDKMAEKMGITGDKITREQFTAHTEKKTRSLNKAMPPGATPGTPGQADPNMLDARAEEMFRRYDANGDGVLDYNEMPDDLKAERDRWDADHNGTIDLSEFKAYFRARHDQMMTDRTQLAGQGTWQALPAETQRAPAAPDPKVKVYHYENLPKELPSWFKEIDTNHDAQIGLYEWKASGRPIHEFLAMDRNNDGFLTVEEVLWYQAKTGKTSTSKGPTSPGIVRGNPVAGSNTRAGVQLDPAMVIDSMRAKRGGR